MQTAAGSGTGSGNVAAVLGNLGFHQYNIQHFPHLKLSVAQTFQNPYVAYCMPKLP